MPLRANADTEICNVAAAWSLGDINGEVADHDIINAGNQLFNARLIEG